MGIRRQEQRKEADSCGSKPEASSDKNLLKLIEDLLTFLVTFVFFSRFRPSLPIQEEPVRAGSLLNQENVKEPVAASLIFSDICNKRFTRNYKSSAEYINAIKR